MLEWDDIPAVFTEEAVEAGLTADLDWFEQQLTSAKKTAAIFPLASHQKPGTEVPQRDAPRTAACRTRRPSCRHHRQTG